jgi:predicted Zn-dependent protease
VLLHEVGHVIGLTHSQEPLDVMSPYYVSDRVELSGNDIKRVQQLLA